MSQEITPNMQPPIKKRRDIYIGCFGWWIIHNLIFLLLLLLLQSIPENEMSLNMRNEFVIIIIWLLALTATVISYLKKRVWVSAGIGIYFITNVTLWIVLLFSSKFLTPIELIMYISLPLPIGYILLATGI